MICHDYDIDIAIFETDFSKVFQNLFALTAVQDGSMFVCTRCPLTGANWFGNSGCEIPFNGLSGKWFKLSGTAKLWKEFGIRSNLCFYSICVHVGALTFGQYPDYADCFVITVLEYFRKI